MHGPLNVKYESVFLYENLESVIEEEKFHPLFYHKGKSRPRTGHVGPEGSRRVKAPSFRDNGTVMVVCCQPYATAAFTPRSTPGTHFC